MISHPQLVCLLAPWSPGIYFPPNSQSRRQLATDCPDHPGLQGSIASLTSFWSPGGQPCPLPGHPRLVSLASSLTSFPSSHCLLGEPTSTLFETEPRCLALHHLPYPAILLASLPYMSGLQSTLQRLRAGVLLPWSLLGTAPHWRSAPQEHLSTNRQLAQGPLCTPPGQWVPLAVQ